MFKECFNLLETLLAVAASVALNMRELIRVGKQTYLEVKLLMNLSVHQSADTQSITLLAVAASVALNMRELIIVGKPTNVSRSEAPL